MKALSLQICGLSLLVSALVPSKAFVLPSNPSFVRPDSLLFAKKKKGPSAAALEALEALDAIDEVVMDEPMSLKDMKKQAKQQKKAAKNDEEPPVANGKAVADEPVNGKPKMSKKEEMLLKALEMEKKDEQNAVIADDEPKLSKKELKALKKKEEKMAAKAEKKNKKASVEDEFAASDPADSASENDVGIPDGAGAAVEEEAAAPTLEDKVRKERPPPRIRVMESSQPGYTSLRLENVGITFRNQEVLKDVTWGVQTGDRIGLVGANGAG